MKISVLMGIYNCENTLSDAIDSLLSQTFTDWELILCDDGSSDGTLAVAQDYVNRYPGRIILLRNEKNMGLNHTLNRCLETAKGTYVARMDGDDLSLPGRFEAETDFLDAHPEFAVVSSPMIYFDENGEWGQGHEDCAEPTPEMLIHGTVHCHAPCMMHAQALRAVGGYSVSPKLLRVEDWHLWVKMYAAGYRGYNLAQPLYKMRDDRSAAGRRKFRYRLNESRVVLAACKAFKLPFWKRIFALRPILVGLLPRPLYTLLHRRRIAAQ